jgi:hypothetical protein
MVSLDPICVQLTPSNEAYPLNVLLLLTSITQYAGAPEIA